MRQDEPRQRAPRALFSELRLLAAIAVAIAGVFSSFLLHPDELIYSPHSDLLAFHHPYRVLQTEALREHGRPGLWDPTAFGGMPLIGDPESGIAYPPTWLHALDATGEGEAWFGWNMVLHVLLGALGMSWWLRGQGFGNPARFAGACAFALSGKWFYHVVVQGHVIFLPLALLPWQLGLVDRILGSRDAAPSGPRRIRAAVGLGITTALVINGSHPQLLLYAEAVGLVVAVVAAATLPWRRVAEALPALALAGALALGLSAVHLLPIAVGLDAYLRGEGLDYATAARRALTLPLGQGLVAPIRLPGEHLQPPFGGVLALALAPFAWLYRAQRARVACCLALLVFCIAYAFGAAGGVHRLFFEVVPGFSLFRIPTRIFLVLGLPLGFLAAAAIEALQRVGWSRSQALLAGVVSLVGLALAGSIGGRDGLHVAACFAATLAFALPLSAQVRAALAVALALGVFADQARYAAPLVQTRPLVEALGHNEVADRLVSPLGVGRVLALGGGASADLSALPATYATRAGIESLRGFNPLIPRATHDYLFLGAAQRPPPSRSKTTIPTFTIRSRPHLDLFNVRWVVSDAPLAIDGLALRETIRDIEIYQFQRPSELTRIDASHVYENVRRMPRAGLVRRARHVAGFEQAVSEIRLLDPRSEVLVEDPALAGAFPGPFVEVPVRHDGDVLALEVDAGEGGYLVLSEVWYPGWRARIDGSPAPLHRVNAIFQGLVLPPGRHRVDLQYRPISYVIGATATLGASALAVGVLGVSSWRARRRD